MKLRKLRLCGFKSFADRTEFEFRDGVTVVVGPNGCGKSNVVDAVKWTLGEQSAKSLRGKEMLDVIFNGSVGRRPAAFAETTLVFENTAGLLPGGRKWVEVSRRLYRSGESEYLLDRTATRLRDVKELFMGTGVGVDAYSVIEQGKVDILLAANPQERRLIFEEAAGISRFKAKKKEALRKLEKVQSNLGRLSDVTEEIDKRLRSLRIQAGKARNYQEYAARLQQLRLRWSLAEYHRLRRESETVGGQVEQTAARRAALSAAHAAAESARAALAAELEEAERASAGLRMAASDARVRAESAAARITDGQRRLAELAEEIGRERSGWDEGRRRCRDLLATPTGEAGHAKLAEQIAGLQAELATLTERSAQRRSESETLTTELDAAKAAVVEWARRFSKLTNELAGVSVHAHNLRANQGKLEARAAGLRAEIDSLAAERDTLAESVRELESFLSERDADRLSAKAETEQRSAERDRLAARLAELDRQLADARARRTALAELDGRLDGVDAGVAEILRRRNSDSNTADSDSAFRSIRGMLADLIRIDRQHVPMLEAALGRNLSSLLVERSDQLFADIRASGGLPGSAQFLCRDRLPPSSDGLRLHSEPDYVGRPMDFVEADPAARPVLEHLLARTIVASSVAGALRLAAKVPRGYRFVTPDGQVVGTDGSLELAASAGTNLASRAASAPGGARGLLGRKAELTELEGRLTRLTAEREGLQASLTEQTAALRELEARQQESRTAIYQAATARAEKAARRDRLEQQLAKLAGEEPGLAAELSGLTEDLAKTDQRIAVLKEAGAKVEARRTSAESVAAERESRGQQLRTAEAADAERSTELRVALSRLASQQDNLRRNAEQMAAARRQAEDSLRAARERLARLAERHEQTTLSVLNSEAEWAELAGRQERAEAELRAARRDRTGQPERLAELTAVAQRTGAELAAVSSTFHKMELSRSESAVRLENLVSRVRDDFGLELADEYQRFLQKEVGGRSEEVGGEEGGERREELGGGREEVGGRREEVAGEEVGDRSEEVDGRSEKVDGEETDAALQAEPELPESEQISSLPHPNSSLLSPTSSPPTSYLLPPNSSPPNSSPPNSSALAELETGDWAAVQAEIAELRGKIDRLGNVNLDSIAELADVEGRAGKLTSQVTDLNDARRQLESLISRIDEESAKLFSQTFAQVRTNFAELFRKLFGGGKADVFLEDEANPLDCGIEIIARPPGKEPRSITLLSGGEKTMTAVAMLLAVFRSKPSPFCILDEVDAALDEANTHRFGGVLSEFTDRSQFIVISHRKPTMSVADVMYGVTMEETGVSKKVAVRFNDHGDIVATDDTGRESQMSLAGG